MMTDDLLGCDEMIRTIGWPRVTLSLVDFLAFCVMSVIGLFLVIDSKTLAGRVCFRLRAELCLCVLLGPAVAC